MKKLFLSLLSLVVAMTMFAQSEAVRQLRLFYDGRVIFTRDVNLVDSMNFAWHKGTGGNIEVGEMDSTKHLYVGVVAFNRDVRQMPITSNVDSVKAFINAQTNDYNQTAFAYSVSKGNMLFDAPNLPKVDKIFMLNFTDGFDNWSNRLWGDEGRQVGQAVYDTARYDLLQRSNMNSYAMAFGDDSAYKTNLQMMVMGSGAYYKAITSNDLQYTFNEIAQSMLASAKNVVLQTNAEYYYENSPKKFQLIFTAEGGYTDTIYASMIGIPSSGYTLTINKISNNYASFDSPAYGVEDPETFKVNIPLNNMKFVKDGEDLQFKYQVKVQTRDGSSYAEDVEDASTSEEISKRIAVVLVLDCSNSMGDAFEPMKAAAVDFIETMEKMEVDTPEPDIPDAPNNPDTPDNPNNPETPDTPNNPEEGVLTFTANGVSFNMITIVGDTFQMGATAEQGTTDPEEDELLIHPVRVSDFAIGETEVTQELWEAVMGSNPSGYVGAKHPVDKVTWHDCKNFIYRLNQATGQSFRLPTEAEWEYAARGGKKSNGYKYAGSNVLDNVAWYTDNSSSTTHPVALKQPNELGIYDMSGNVMEWCEDWYGTYPETLQTNPIGSASGSDKVFRGGCWGNYARLCRVSDRGFIDAYYAHSYLGLRLALDVPTAGTYQYVDLGLSVKWATFNVGASKPEEYGDYFAWGETRPKTVYDWSTYKWCNGSQKSLTKYNCKSSNGSVDNKTVLELSDDAARASWGGEWRMPTYNELSELRSNCIWTRTTMNGIDGYKVTSKVNGNYIFLPAAGQRSGNNQSGGNTSGYYWSRECLSGSYSSEARILGFNHVENYDTTVSRYAGFSIRPVHP